MTFSKQLLDNIKSIADLISSAPCHSTIWDMSGMRQQRPAPPPKGAGISEGAMQMIYGIPVVRSPLLQARPKVRIQDTSVGSPEKRGQVNAWLLDRFGYEEEKAYMIGDRGSLVMSPRVYQSLICLA